MKVRPSGTVTFLFTDIEGSTRRWESDADGMRAELMAHDDVLRSVVEGHGGWLFKHTGDGICAAFQSAQAAVDGAVAAQRRLGLPVRMGIATGEAEQRGDDYFGPVVNRAARVMAVGHGSQILVSASSASLVDSVDLVDLGEHRLRDIARPEHLFQVRADGLRSEFPRIRTVDAGTGNLPRHTTSFVGRDAEVNAVCGLVAAHDMVTLTGVGGVGKTRLALQVATELCSDFPDGAWLIELAAIGDAAAVPDAVAASLGIVTQPGQSVTNTIAHTLRGRRMLIVFDNCEHVVDAAADLIETILQTSATVKVLATSREGLRLDAEHLWPVPSLAFGDGPGSPAVTLFIERARAVDPGFALSTGTDMTAVIEICRRLDGIALAIELAAARMVAMTPADVLARLNDRFRLLSGSRRSLERHQTLRHAMQWSYDLLTIDEQAMLAAAAMFSGGFELPALTSVSGSVDDAATVDMLDALVRKSLITVSRASGRARYTVLETVRQFTEDQHTDVTLGELRDRHALHYASEVTSRWDTWDGPGYQAATEWVETEIDNLRAGFRWSVERGDLTTATAIAAHTPMISFAVQQFEPAGWAEEILSAVTEANLAQLPRLATAASLCMFTGRPDHAVEYAHNAVALHHVPGYQPFADGWADYRESYAHLAAGRVDRAIEICKNLAAQTGLPHVIGLCGLTVGLPIIGHADDAIAIADDAMTAAHRHANPYFVAFAHYGAVLAFSLSDPTRALAIANEGLDYASRHHLPFFTAYLTSEAAWLETTHGDLDRGLDLFHSSLDLFHQSGDPALVGTLQYLAIALDELGQPGPAATLYGTTTRTSLPTRNDVEEMIAHLKAILSPDSFQQCVNAGAPMNASEAVHYAHHHIELARQQQR
jgi:predicted ATPase